MFLKRFLLFFVDFCGKRSHRRGIHKNPKEGATPAPLVPGWPERRQGEQISSYGPSELQALQGEWAGEVSSIPFADYYHVTVPPYGIPW